MEPVNSPPFPAPSKAAAMEEARKQDNQQVLRVLEALKQASHDLHNNPFSRNKDSNSSAIKALLELQTEADNILSNDPNLLNLSSHITNLKTLIHKLNHHKNHHSLPSFLRSKIISYEISCVASSIETEIQAWIDRESIENLVKTLQEDCVNEDEKVKLLSQFEERVSQGFDMNLQELILKWKIFSFLESILCDPKCSKRIREKSGFAIDSLVQFNKNVFVGEVLMGFTITALISIGSSSSIQVLCSLIKSIRLPLVDEIEGIDGIPKLIYLLYSQVELSIKVITLDCIFEIAYYARKEAIQVMLQMELVEKLVELQRSELGGDLIEMDCEEDEASKGVCAGGVDKVLRRKKSCRERKFLEKHPFTSCVARFAIQIEVGEGLRHREKTSVKQEIVKRVREACFSDAEAATIVAEVLWGSSP